MTTYYVDGAVGNDANAGTAEGAGNAFATINHALSVATTGNDIVYVKASATYAENVQPPGITPSANTTILVAGYTTTPGDHGFVTIAPSSGLYCINTAGFYYYWCNFICDASNVSSNAINSGSNYHTFFNCVAKNSSARGFSVGNWNPIVKCVAYNNTGIGIFTSSYGGVWGSIAYNNGQQGINAQTTTHAPVYRCVAYNNVREQIIGSLTLSNTAYAPDTVTAYSAISLTHGGAPYVKGFDNIAYGGDYPFHLNSTGGALVTMYNLGYLGTVADTWQTGSDDAGWSYIHDAFDLVGDPAFTDIDGGDFTLGDGSAAVGAGLTPGTIVEESS